MADHVFEVEMHSYAADRIRSVTVPGADYDRLSAGDGNQPDIHQLLETIFYYGQNDFQPQDLPSVSVGDVVRVDGRRFRVEPVGWSECPG